MVADVFDLPHPLGKFDFAISIAVLHHLSTPERRIEGVQHILDTLRPGGRALVYVWALEQKDSRRGWDEGHEQDVMVPWVLRHPQPKTKKPKKNQKGGEAEQAPTEPTVGPIPDKTFHRYYHLYRKGELDSNVESAGGIVIDSGYDRDNWWAIAERKQT